MWFTAVEEEECPGICETAKRSFSITIINTGNGDVCCKLSGGLFITNKTGQ